MSQGEDIACHQQVMWWRMGGLCTKRCEFHFYLYQDQGRMLIVIKRWCVI